ncbi:hypothetical protein [Helicobacter sp. 11S02629-2]|uniref:hypothetical protein n=1 Tax=Helicobacter sp. 11S02629-2 TaxID=1476195 RepID=UPI000BA7CB31|nr:hypothetical protein [Helicobacter sp. 11S02629-2]PAF42752.1 hypothetical protein BKH40_07610 [Helicobacter sp. 11S02629-2]
MITTLKPTYLINVKIDLSQKDKDLKSQVIGYLPSNSYLYEAKINLLKGQENLKVSLKAGNFSLFSSLSLAATEANKEATTENSPSTQGTQGTQEAKSSLSKLFISAETKSIEQDTNLILEYEGLEPTKESTAIFEVLLLVSLNTPKIID